MFLYKQGKFLWFSHRVIQYESAACGGWAEATDEPWMRSHDGVAPFLRTDGGRHHHLALVEGSDNLNSAGARKQVVGDMMLVVCEKGMHSNFAAHANTDFGRAHAYAFQQTLRYQQPPNPQQSGYMN
jgi:hypothetical protein